MLFNSIEYLFIFLPVVALGFYLIRRVSNGRLISSWLTLCSLFFYGFWAPKYLLLILFSVVTNFYLGKKVAQSDHRRGYLLAGFAINIGLLAYYKYTQFLLDNVSLLFGEAAPVLGIILPIGISFYTFQQISFLVDAYRDREMPYDFRNYMLFVTFFPQLIAGPIVYHKEMMPQFAELPKRKINWDSIYSGLFLICLGLVKKVVIADQLGVWVDEGYTNLDALNFWTAWKTSLAYTFQLYYDFSGYMDIALGSARLFDIRLPINFNSPYRSLNIQEFWQRWHITLGRFLKNYVYFPLGGNRVGPIGIYLNLFLTFIIGGIWHGAGWTFLFWGALHGIAMAFHRFLQLHRIRFPKPIAWLATFLFVNAAWVYFRAPDFQSANAIISSMCHFSPQAWTIFNNVLQKGLEISSYLVFIALFVAQDHFFRDSHEWTKNCKNTPVYTGFIVATLFVCSLMILSESMQTEFLYFQF